MQNNNSHNSNKQPEANGNSNANSNKGNNNNKKGGKSKAGNKNQHRQQPKKDSRSERVNYDNARVDKVTKRIMSDAKSGKFNDINDFLRNPMLLKSAASYPVFPILGSRPWAEVEPVPGVMAFYWEPNFGTYQRGKAVAPEGETVKLSPPPIALNQAMDSTYSFIVHANSRNYSYNAPDLFLLILAGANVFCIIQSMLRAYGYAKRYVETSLYQPDTVLYAMGFNAKDLKNNLGQAWFDLNNLITQTRQIWVPNVFPLVSRWMDMNSNLYKDAPGDYAQTYVFVQNRYYIYDETSSETGGCLKSVDVGDGATKEEFTPRTSNYSWSQWVSVAQSMIDALVNSEDRGIIYGDLLNAYSAERIIALPEVSSDYVIDREYSPEISMQIENMMLFHQDGCPNALYQVNNDLYPGYKTAYPSKSFPVINVGSSVLNFHVESDPSPEMILLATRFATLGLRAAMTPLIKADGSMTSQPTYVPYVAGSEIVTGMKVYVQPGMNNQVDQFDSSIITNIATVDAKWLHLMAFDWHPFAYVTPSGTAPAVTEASATNGTVYTSAISSAYGDWDRYSHVDTNFAGKINDVAEYSLYGVPQL